MFLKIAKDEAQTLYEYQGMIQDAEDMNEEEKAIVDEIMSDEFNHCLIALLSASKIMGVKIAPDEIEPNPNEMKVTEGE